MPLAEEVDWIFGACGLSSERDKKARLVRLKDKNGNLIGQGQNVVGAIESAIVHPSMDVFRRELHIAAAFAVDVKKTYEMVALFEDAEEDDDSEEVEPNDDDSEEEEVRPRGGGVNVRRG